MQLTIDDLIKPKTQKDRILDRLKSAGLIGVTNYELNEICFRYSARIDDLRKEGYQISTIKEDGSRFRWVLHQEVK